MNIFGRYTNLHVKVKYLVTDIDIKLQHNLIFVGQTQLHSKLSYYCKSMSGQHIQFHWKYPVHLVTWYKHKCMSVVKNQWCAIG